MPGAMTFPPLKCAFGICSWKYSTKWQACSVNRSSRVFSEPERRTLLALELPVSDVLEDRMLQEKYLAYAALCGASEKLYLTYPVSVGQEAKSPGELISAVELALPNLKITQNLPPEFFANAPEAAFSQTGITFPQAKSKFITSAALNTSAATASAQRSAARQRSMRWNTVV